MRALRCEFFPLASLPVGFLRGMQYTDDHNSKPEDRPTAATLLRESDFCVLDPDYDFMNTELASKLGSSGLVSLGE